MYILAQVHMPPFHPETCSEAQGERYSSRNASWALLAALHLGTSLRRSSKGNKISMQHRCVPRARYRNHSTRNLTWCLARLH